MPAKTLTREFCIEDVVQKHQFSPKFQSEGCLRVGLLHVQTTHTVVPITASDRLFSHDRVTAIAREWRQSKTHAQRARSNPRVVARGGSLFNRCFPENVSPSTAFKHACARARWPVGQTNGRIDLLGSVCICRLCITLCVCALC